MGTLWQLKTLHLHNSQFGPKSNWDPTEPPYEEQGKADQKKDQE